MDIISNFLKKVNYNKKIDNIFIESYYDFIYNYRINSNFIHKGWTDFNEKL